MGCIKLFCIVYNYILVGFYSINVIWISRVFVDYEMKWNECVLKLF